MAFVLLHQHAAVILATGLLHEMMERSTWIDLEHQLEVNPTRLLIKLVGGVRERETKEARVWLEQLCGYGGYCSLRQGGLGDEHYDTGLLFWTCYR